MLLRHHIQYKREIKKLRKLQPGIDLSGSPRNKYITTAQAGVCVCVCVWGYIPVMGLGRGEMGTNGSAAPSGRGHGAGNTLHNE